MASGFTIKTNFAPFIKELNSRKSELNRAAIQAMTRGMDLFTGRIQKMYYSGRPGLQAPTGTLRRGWHVSAVFTGQGGLNTSVKLGNSQVYARIHEYGGVIKAKGSGYLSFVTKNVSYRIKPTKSGKHTRMVTSNFIRVKSVTIPKRTDVRGEFKRTGFDTIKRQVALSINQTLKLRG